MINVDDEVNKHRNCKDRDELGRLIKEYKNLALQYASNLALTMQYNKVAQRLQEICDKLPAPRLIKYPAGTPSRSVKTATVTSEEQAKIDAAWRKKTKS